MSRSILCIFFATFLIASCAINSSANGTNQSRNPAVATNSETHQPKSTPLDRPADSATYTGRISLSFETPPEQTTAPSSFAGSFELRGNAQAGELDLLSPLGSIVAQLRWTPLSASLKSSGKTSIYPSASTMIEQVTGAALSPELLFSWLRGDNPQTPLPTQPTEKWQVDLSGHAQGRITAKRFNPAPTAILRIIIEPL